MVKKERFHGKQYKRTVTVLLKRRIVLEYQHLGLYFELVNRIHEEVLQPIPLPISHRQVLL
jgi:hypothetical protein